MPVEPEPVEQVIQFCIPDIDVLDPSQMPGYVIRKVSFDLVLVQVIHGDHDPCFLHFAEIAVEDRTEGAHRGREAHVCIDQRGDGLPQCPYFPG